MSQDLLSDSELFHLVLEVQNGKAEASDARRIIAELHRLMRTGAPIPDVLRSFLQDAFAKILGGEPAENAFRLKRTGAGRPPNREVEERDIKTAQEVLRRRLEGMTLEEAADDVAESTHRGATQVRGAYAKHKHQALILLRIERSLDEFPWSLTEIKRLTEIFEGDPWFIAPGNSRNNPA